MKLLALTVAAVAVTAQRPKDKNNKRGGGGKGGQATMVRQPPAVVGRFVVENEENTGCDVQWHIGPRNSVYRREDCDDDEYNYPYSQPTTLRRTECAEDNAGIGGMYLENDPGWPGEEGGWASCYCVAWGTVRDTKYYRMWYGYPHENVGCDDVDLVCPSLDEIAPAMSNEDPTAVGKMLAMLGWKVPDHMYMDSECVFGCEQTCDASKAETHLSQLLPSYAKFPPAIQGEWLGLENDGDAWRSGCRMEQHFSEDAVSYIYVDREDEDCEIDWHPMIGPSVPLEVSCYEDMEHGAEGKPALYGRIVEDDSFYDPSWEYQSCLCYYYNMTYGSNVQGIWGHTMKVEGENCVDLCPDTPSLTDWYLPVSYRMKYGATYEMKPALEPNQMGEYTCGHAQQCGEPGRIKGGKKSQIIKVNGAASACDCKEKCAQRHDDGHFAFDTKKKKCLCYPSGAGFKMGKGKEGSTVLAGEFP